MAQPEGLVYRPELISESDEQALVNELERLDFHEIRMHGVVAKRTARHFGIDYDYERRTIVHRDAPMFGIVLGVSLLAAARLRFRRDVPGGERETYEVTLDPRSGYVLAGEALTTWQHHIPPAKSARYSITFRTLRG